MIILKLDKLLDLFTCNVLGQSFEFYLDNNNQPHFVELTDWTIEYFRSEQKFILKDSQGLVYEFGGGLLDATGFGENHSGYYTEITSIGIDGAFTSGITAWNLKSITHFTGEQINFEYKTKTYYKILDIQQMKRATSFNSAFFTILPLHSRNSQIRFKAPRGLYLHKITSVKDEVYFNSVVGQMGSKILASIEGTKKKVEFNIHKYSTNSRYFLSGIKFKPLNDNDHKTYEFEYKSPELLPARLSFAQDHWGYYNGATLNTSLLIHHPLAFPNENADREVDETVLDYGVLSKIIYPTKGVEKFEYESNHTVKSNGTKNYYGGVRLKKRISRAPDVAHSDIIKKYEYFKAYPAHFNPYLVANIEIIQTDESGVASFSLPNIRNSSHREKEEFGTNPNDYMYGKVVEVNSDSSTIEHYFENGLKVYVGIMPNAHYNSNFLPAVRTLVIGNPKETHTVFYRKNKRKPNAPIYAMDTFSEIKNIIYYRPIKVLDTIMPSYFRKKFYNSADPSYAPWYPNWEDCISPEFHLFSGGHSFKMSLLSGIALQ